MFSIFVEIMRVIMIENLVEGATLALELVQNPLTWLE